MANTLLDAKKEKEITHVVELLKQIELPDILLIGRDANTLLMRQKEAEAMEREDKSAYTPQDMLVDMHGMSRKDLKDGIVAYGQSSLHAVACVTAKILNEDGDVKYKAYPNCTITNGLSRTVDNDTEDVAMLELEIAVMPDEDGEGMYEAVESDLQDATVKTKWMEEFSRELVELNA